MNALLTRSVAIALALTLGAASLSTAFAATASRGNTSSSSASSSTGSTSTGANSDHSDRPLAFVIGAQDSNLRNPPVKPAKPVNHGRVRCAAGAVNGQEATDCTSDTATPSAGSSW